MSYKLNLSGLQRGGAVSITQQLVDRITAAIEAGELEPGEKLPPTRELAERAEREPPHGGARVPQARRARLRQRNRRARHVRPHADPREQRSHGDDWQVYALPPDELTYSEQVLADTFSSPAGTT